MALKSFSSGSNGAIQSAKMPAAANMTSTMTRPMVPSGLRPAEVERAAEQRVLAQQRVGIVGGGER